MRILYLSACIAFSVFNAPGQLRAEQLTLDQAVKLALEVNPMLEIQRQIVAEARAERLSRSLLPNPLLTYNREELELAEASGGEWILAAEMPLDFIWRRGPLLSEAEASIEAENYGLAALREQVRLETSLAYIETHFGRQELQARQRSSEILQEIREKSRVLKSEGDMSGYDQRRITFEVFRSRRDQVLAENALGESEKKLNLLVYQDSLSRKVETVESFPNQLPELSAERLVATALERRADLKRSRTRISALRAAVQAAKRGALPGLGVSLGYKRQVDGFEGPVGYFNLRLPLFDRNQGAVAGNQARLNAGEVTAAAQERQIAAEVETACQNYLRLREQLAEYRANMLDNPELLIETASFSYLEGEVSLVEWIDAVRTYTEDAVIRFGLLRDCYLSLYRLELLTGGDLH